MVFVDFIKELLPILTLIGGILVILLLLVLIAVNNKSGPRTGVAGIVARHGLLFAFIVALTATLGSLFYSEIAQYTPCKLCWWQRIFMYPQVILLGVALWRKDVNIRLYAILLAIIGGAISTYHYIIQRLAVVTSCSIDGGESCASIQTFHYGYITIPMMALTAFFLIILFLFGMKTANTKTAGSAAASKEAKSPAMDNKL